MPATAHIALVKRLRLEIRGIVQGVGFRPFIHNLAHSLSLAGFVLNSSAGVTVEVEGSAENLALFQQRLRAEVPPLAQIDDLAVNDVETCGEHDFSIRQSTPAAGEFVLVSPDMATCGDCLADSLRPAGRNPDTRRRGYPFTNCTNCGPRYTIIRDIPYDRRHTTMAGFVMCAACQAEYDNPRNRRFHAQPNACPQCGPGLVLLRQGDAWPESGLAFSSGRQSQEILADVRELLRDGKIIAVKGLGGFLLCCDAENEQAVGRLRSRKRRSDKPFALMARDVEAIRAICSVSSADVDALCGPECPIVVLDRLPDARIAANVAPGNDTVGVMLSCTPLHALLFGDSPGNALSPEGAAPEFTALVMTSGNISEEPIVVSNEDAWQRLATVADCFLFHNRDIFMRVDDSVVCTFAGRTRFLRRSRGYVPRPIDLGIPLQEVLACGAHLKNTFCLTRDRYAILSQHIGDLENYETMCFFEETLENLKKLFRFSPAIVAHDLHPHYMSTRFALALPQTVKVGVQHHHAHIASCMAENRLRDKVIGVALDGTGYGTDGQIWGGEFLVADFAGFERRAHLRYVPLAGGDAAVRQPWRAALAHLHQTFGAGSLPQDLPLWQHVPAKHVALVQTMLQRGVNTVNTSSCGRLFDAVASLTGLRHEVNFEGQAAIELEMAARRHNDEEQRYPFLIGSGEPCQIDLRPMIEAVVRDLATGTVVGLIAARFHNTLASLILEVCLHLRRQDKLDRVCLSGGTFQNMLLLQRTVAALTGGGFKTYLHSAVPPNDGGISLGQAVIANAVTQQAG